jgi:hypothetical protein
MEIIPTILSDVIYDLETRTFFCKDAPLYPLDTRAFSIDIPLVNPVDICNIVEPTYIMHGYHSCWGHAYEFTLGLLSILHEYDPQRLSTRNYRLFILHQLPSDDYRPDLIQWLIEWEIRYIDHSRGKYNEPYTELHECISSLPILFEQTVKYRYIHFDTILYGGNLNNQRNIHNCHERFFNRQIVPVATDEQIQGWMSNAKSYLKDYLRIKDKVIDSNKKVLFIDRKGRRALTEESKAALTSILMINPIYMEDCSFTEQIQAFVNADIVITVHGTCLFHLIWSAPGTRIIEIHGGTLSATQIFRSYSQYLSQQIHQIFTTHTPWEAASFIGPIQITQENSDDIRELITSWTSPSES